MPRPVFGQADWFTFKELETTFARRLGRYDDGFENDQAAAADGLARRAFGDDEDGTDPWCGPFVPTWPGFEFCVSRVNKVVLMVRRREA